MAFYCISSTGKNTSRCLLHQRSTVEGVFYNEEGIKKGVLLHFLCWQGTKRGHFNASSIDDKRLMKGIVVKTALCHISSIGKTPCSDFCGRWELTFSITITRRVSKMALYVILFWRKSTFKCLSALWKHRRDPLCITISHECVFAAFFPLLARKFIRIFLKLAFYDIITLFLGTICLTTTNACRTERVCARARLCVCV